MDGKEYARWSKALVKACVHLHLKARGANWPFGESPFSYQFLAQQVVMGCSMSDRQDTIRQRVKDGWKPEIVGDYHLTASTPEEWPLVLAEVQRMSDLGHAYISHRIWQVNAWTIGRPPFPVRCQYTQATPTEYLAFYGQQRERGDLRTPLLLRHLAPDSGWKLHQLPGSLWVNLHSGQPCVIGPLSMDNWNRPEVVRLARDLPSKYETLGLWDEGYVVDHWLRIDHLPEENRRAWALWALAGIVKDRFEYLKAGGSDWHEQRYARNLATLRTVTEIGETETIAAENAARSVSGQDTVPVQLRLL